MAGMDQDGEHDRQQDTLLDADEDHHQGSDQCHPELDRALSIDLAHPHGVDQLNSDQKDHGREHCLRHVGQRLGQEQQYDSTMTAVVSVASWLRPPALLTIWVLVGLPFTTNVPLKPAPILAKPSPTRSTFSLKVSL